MKLFYVGLLTLCLLICACWLSQREIVRRTGAVLAPLSRASEAARLGDYKESVKQAEFARTEWETHEAILSSLMDHRFTNAITDGLEELKLLDKQAFLFRCEELIRSIRALSEIDLPVWKNIF